MDRKIEKKRWPPKKIAGLSIVGIFGLLVLYNFLFGDSRSTLNVETEKLTVATVTQGAFQEFIPVSGNVIPMKTVYLDAIEGGRVEQIFLEEGSLVKQGDAILKLANNHLQLDIMNREAQVFEQINNLRNTRLAVEQNRLMLQGQLVELDYQIQRQKQLYDRRAELVKKQLIAQQEYEQARDEYAYLLKKRAVTLESQKQSSLFRQVQIEQLEASVQRMQANLEMVKQNLENLIIKAPVSGQLTALNAEIGESKSPGERLGQIDILEGFKVRAAIDEHYIARIQTGLAGECDVAGRSYALGIKKVYPEVGEGKFEVDMEFTGNTPEGIRRGQTLHIRLALGDPAEAVLLPRGGFYQKTGGQWVYVLDRSGTFATKRAVKLGRQNPQVFEVLEGLEPGERVITSTYESFGEIEKLVLKKR